MGFRRSGSRNPLLRRVRRHANTSVIFRSHTGDDDLDTVRPAPVQRAYVPSQSAPLMPIVPTAVAPNKPITPPVVQQEESTSEWVRLKRILQAHEEKVATETKSESSTESTADDQVQRAINAAEAFSSEEPQSSKPALQDMWPVQSKSPTQSKPTSTPMPTESKSVVQRNPAEETQLKDKLNSIKAKKPTDSSIEIHTPRRPRPMPPGAQQKPPVQRKPTEEAKPSKPAEPPTMVPTEIGPLPSDLWELLGETPPIQRKEEISQEPSIDQTIQEDDAPTSSSSSTADDAIQRAIAKAEASAISPTSKETPVVQPKAEPSVKVDTPKVDATKDTPKSTTGVAPNESTPPIQRQPEDTPTSPPSSTADDAIQRAIAKAEAAPPE